jgi:site-specific DNA recombinase
VRRDRVEETLLRLIYEEVFSPETVAYVSRKVNETLARRADSPCVARKRREAELTKARAELENVKSAIRQGIITPSTKEMLEAAERRVADLEAALKAPEVESKIAVLPSLVQLYLNDLKGSLGRDTDRARALLAKLIGRVTLRREGQRLVAELQGNLSGLLELDDQPLYKGGSGGPILIVSAVSAPASR